jgi:hypothetical protein
MISGEVWERLDHRAGMLSRRVTRHWVVAAIGTGIVMLILVVASLKGMIVPRLTQQGGGDSGSSTHGDEIGRLKTVESEVERTFVNEGWLPVTVTGVGVRAGGLTLRSVRTRDGKTIPFTIPAGGSVSLSLRLEISDCAAALSGDAPVVFEVETWWGTMTREASHGDEEEPWLEFPLHTACG